MSCGLFEEAVSHQSAVKGLAPPRVPRRTFRYFIGYNPLRELEQNRIRELQARLVRVLETTPPTTSPS